MRFTNFAFIIIIIYAFYCQGHHLSKFGFRTETTGSVTAKINIMMQSRQVAYCSVVFCLQSIPNILTYLKTVEPFG